VQCTYDAAKDLIEVTHGHVYDAKDDQTAIEGKAHHCLYNKHTDDCTCKCATVAYAGQHTLYQTYNSWYCKTNNGNNPISTHISYTPGTNPDLDQEPDCSGYA